MFLMLNLKRQTERLEKIMEIFEYTYKYILNSQGPLCHCLFITAVGDDIHYTNSKLKRYKPEMII